MGDDLTVGVSAEERERDVAEGSGGTRVPVLTKTHMRASRGPFWVGRRLPSFENWKKSVLPPSIIMKVWFFSHSYETGYSPSSTFQTVDFTSLEWF